MANPTVSLIMGSSSDWSVMHAAADILDQFGVLYEKCVISAHRTPGLMAEFSQSAASRGIRCIVAGAGGAAHLPGMVAAMTPIPVLGVPVSGKYLSGQDSLYSIVQMPKGIPVATFAIGEAGAANAGLFAVSILANDDRDLKAKLDEFRAKQTSKVLGTQLPD